MSGNIKKRESSKAAVEVTILMPCLNEAETLPKCINWAKEALAQLSRNGFDGEILIADNGSTDGSQAIANECGCRVVECRFRGYGNALICGCKAAGGKYIVMGDSDASYDFREAVPMVEKLRDGYDLCMGTRLKGEIMPGAMPWKNRWIGNPILTGIMNIFFRTGLSDAHCGLRAFTRSAFDKMQLTSQGMEFASEMVVKATLFELKRTEIPVTLHKDGRSRPPHLNPWQDGWRHLKFLLLYSPLWLFFVPSLLLLMPSIFILTALLLREPGEMVNVVLFSFGMHWLPLASAGLVVGYQIGLLGLIALSYHAKQDIFPVPVFFERIIEHFSLENIILISLFWFLLGIVIFIYVIYLWSETGFGQLNAINFMIVVGDCIILGFQTFFSGFLFSLMNLDITSSQYD